MSFASKFSRNGDTPNKQEPIFYNRISIVRLGLVAYHGVEYDEHWHDISCKLTEITTLFPDESPYKIQYSYRGHMTAP